MAKSFTQEQEEKMLDYGIKTGGAIPKINLHNGLVKYEWKSIVHKYKVWLELNKKGAI